MAETYYYSDGNVTFRGVSDRSESISIYDDANGSFDFFKFSFVKSGDDLLIDTGEGSTITLEDHFLNSIAAFTVIGLSPSGISEKLYSAAIGETADATITVTTEARVLGGSGDNTIYMDLIGGYKRVYANGGDDTIYSTGEGLGILYGGAGNDTFHVTADEAYGGDGDDVFYTNSTSILGSIMHGGAGNNTYHITAEAFGSHIHAAEATDNEVIFGSGITFENMYITSGVDAISFETTDSAVVSGAPLSLLSGTVNNGNTNRVIFDNGEVYELTKVTNVTNRLFTHSLTASDDDDIIYAAGGSYNLNAGGGNDIIYGNDYAGISGNPSPAYLYGNDGDDIIYNSESTTSDGGNGNDIIHGTDGFDNIYGGNGDDIIYANGNTHPSRDEIHGGAGNDLLYTGTGSHKSMYGGDGCDVIISDLNQGVSFSGSGRTHFLGGSGNDVYIFKRDDASDQISAKSWINDTSGGYDTIVLDAGFSLSGTDIAITGGMSITDLHPTRTYHMIEVNHNFPGNVIERVLFADGTIYDTVNQTVLTATNGDDNPVYLTAWHDTFDALGGDDVVYALKGDDHVNGNTGNDTLYGEAGDDTLIGGAGNDALDGGDGFDTADYSAVASGVSVNLQNSTASNDGDGGVDTLTSIERVIGSNFNDVIYGSNFADEVLEGRGGDDTLVGYVGDDMLLGGDGNDTLVGYGGEDLLEGGDGNDTLNGSGDRDTLNGGSGDDVFDDDIDSVIDGGADNDWARFYNDIGRLDLDLERTGTEMVRLDAATGLATGVTGSITNVETITATHLDDVLRGDANNNTLRGYNGDDEIYGRDGDDRLDGNDGDDTIYGGNGNDIIHGQAGSDIMYGGAGDDLIYGTAGDTLYGDDGHDGFVLYGGEALIDGGAGDDTANWQYASGSVNVDLAAEVVSLNGGSNTSIEGVERITGTAGHDVITGDGASNRLRGYDGDDVLNGGAGNDILYGQNGDDTLYANEGADYLYGGGGVDAFIVSETASQDNDMAYVFDFDEVAETIDVSDLLSGYDPLTDSITDFITIAQATHTTIQIDRDGTGTAHSLDNVLRLQNNSTIDTDVQQLINDGTLIIA